MRFSHASRVACVLAGLTLCAQADDDKLKNGTTTEDAAVAPATKVSAPLIPSTSGEPKLRLGLDYGAGFVYAPSDDEDGSSTAEDDLRKGNEFRISAAYMATPNIGVGLVYSRFASTATGSETNSYYDYNTYRTITETMSYDATKTVGFVGAMLAYRSATTGGAFTSSVMLGKLSYELSADVSVGTASGNSTITGTGIGVGLSVGGEINLNRNVAIALELNSMQGTIKDAELDGRSLEGEEDISRVGVSAGLRVYL